MDYIVLDMEWNRAVDYTQIVKLQFFSPAKSSKLGQQS